MKASSNNNSGNSTFNNNSAIPTPTNLIKKCYSITDILKYHLVTTGSHNLFCLNCINFIEESCAKSYIKSVIHYMGIYSTKYAQRSLPASIVLNPPIQAFDPLELTFRQKFEQQSISQLLRIAKKNKLVDLDLTDFLKKHCFHLKRQKNETNDLEKKFDSEKKCYSNHHHHHHHHHHAHQQHNQHPGTSN